MLELKAFTDGACSGNPGPGGWGVVLQAINAGEIVKERELSGGAGETTNNQMELMAAISALETLERASSITVVTDSSYVKDGVSTWIHGWKRNGWKTAAKKPVKNVELWQRLDAAQARHNVTWEWVKGHAGHPENERADALARAGMEPYKPKSRFIGPAHPTSNIHPQIVQMPKLQHARRPARTKRDLLQHGATQCVHLVLQTKHRVPQQCPHHAPQQIRYLQFCARP